MARRSASDPTTRHPSQLLALAIGAIYTLVGILGFFVTGFENFAAETDKTLLGFEINPLHNLVHLAIGLAGLALWRRLDTARIYGWLLAAGYGLAFLYGLVDRQQRHQLPVPQRRRHRPAPGQRGRRGGHRPMAGRPDRPPARVVSPTAAPDPHRRGMMQMTSTDNTLARSLHDLGWPPGSVAR